MPNVENPKLGDIDVILGILKLDKTKYQIVSLLQNEKIAKTCWARDFLIVAKMV